MTSVTQYQVVVTGGNEGEKDYINRCVNYVLATFPEGVKPTDRPHVEKSVNKMLLKYVAIVTSTDQELSEFHLKVTLHRKAEYVEAELNANDEKDVERTKPELVWTKASPV